MPPRKKLISKDGRKRVDSPAKLKANKGLRKKHWRKKFSDIVEISTHAMKKKFLTDVTFMVGPDETICHAHRLILALGSPVFEAMFYGTLAEKGDIVKVPDIAPVAFQHLLRFIYSGDTVFKNDLEAFKTIFAAEKYCINRLKSACEKYLSSCMKINPKNVWNFLESAYLLNSETIKERCLRFLKYKTGVSLLHPSFLDISGKSVEAVLSLDTINTSEIRLLQHVYRWAENASQFKGTDSFVNIVRPLLPLIRFGSLTPEQFIRMHEMKHVKDLISDEDALNILKHLVMPQSFQLPEWCCKKVWQSNSLSRKKKTLCGSSMEHIPTTRHIPTTEHNQTTEHIPRLEYVLMTLLTRFKVQVIGPNPDRHLNNFGAHPSFSSSFPSSTFLSSQRSSHGSEHDPFEELYSYATDESLDSACDCEFC